MSLIIEISNKMSRKSQRNGGHSGQGRVCFSKTIKTVYQRLRNGSPSPWTHHRESSSPAKRPVDSCYVTDRWRCFLFPAWQLSGSRDPQKIAAKSVGCRGTVTLDECLYHHRRGVEPKAERDGFHGEYKNIGSDECARGCIWSHFIIS